MAGLFKDDESTDDEIGVNLQLAERLRINRGENSNFVEDTRFENSKDFKQYCNMRRKQFAHDGQSSSSSSIEIQNDSSASGVARYDCITSQFISDIYHNKKRQNGDKNTEQLANPKRTCLSDRLRRSPEWRDLRKKASNNESHSKHSKYSERFHLQSGTSSDLFSDKKNEEHVNSLADAEDSDFEVPPKITKNLKKSSGQNSKVCKNHCSSSPDVMIQFPSRPCTNYFCKFLESGSDDESKSIIQNGALKGGRQESSDQSYSAKKFLGRKINRKVLDSDDSEDDNSVGVYRSRPLVFTSSDSEDLRQTTPKNKPAGAVCNGTTSHGHPYGDGYENNSCNRPSRLYKSLRSNQKFPKKTSCVLPSSRADSSDGCDHQFLSSDFQRKNTPNRSCRNRRSSRTNIAGNLTSGSFTNGNNLSAPVRGRRINGSERGTRRSVSPHHRNLSSHRRSDDSKCSRGRSISASRTQKNKPSYAARYPDVFDAEESDNEFFTANSYSDTETSTESLGGLTINASFPSHRGSISCSIDCEEKFLDDISTDDEISVVFSTGPYGRNNDTRRSTSRTLGRRYNRGTPHRPVQSAQEVVSLSPDPVEQVRQVEEDERMARMLQAQFDAEIDPTYSPPHNLLVEAHDDSEDDIIDPIGDSDSDGGIHSFAPYVLPIPHSRGFRINRFSYRPGTPNSVSTGTFITNRSRIRRRSYFPAPRERNDLQLARLFGLNFSPMPSVLDGDDYETLLSLDLDGDVIPRGLPRSEINRLPTRKYIHPNSASTSSSGSEVTHKRTDLNKECQVCLTDYETGDVLRILPCFHEFHTPCIDPWLKINHSCPVCRVTVDLDA